MSDQPENPTNADGYNPSKTFTSMVQDNFSELISRCSDFFPIGSDDPFEGPSASLAFIEGLSENPEGRSESAVMRTYAALQKSIHTLVRDALNINDWIDNKNDRISKEQIIAELSDGSVFNKARDEYEGFPAGIAAHVLQQYLNHMARENQDEDKYALTISNIVAESFGS